MGSWNETCAISNLPILEGEACRLVLLVKSPPPEQYHAGFSAAFDLWTPWSLPLLGVYADYGNVDIEHGWHTRFILDRLQKKVVEVDESHEFLEDAVRKTDLTGPDGIHRLQQLIGRGRVRVIEGLEKDPIELGSCIVRDDVYTALAETPAVIYQEEFTLEDAVAREVGRYADVRVSGIDTGELDKAIEELGDTEAARAVRSLKGAVSEYRKLAEILGSYGPAGYSGIGAYQTHIHESLSSGISRDDPEIIEAIAEYATFVHVLRHFGLLRKLWSPQAGAGSQTTGWESYGALAGVVAAIAERGVEAEADLRARWVHAKGGTGNGNSE